MENSFVARFQTTNSFVAHLTTTSNFVARSLLRILHED